MANNGDKFEHFDRLAQHNTEQKERVLGGATTGYEPHMHDLYRKLAPDLTAKYGGRTARDCVFLLGYLHAHRLGEGAAREKRIDKRLIGWAFPKDNDIREQVGLSHDKLRELREILVSERLVIVKKRHYDRHPKLYYLPFYAAYEGELSGENDRLGR